MLGGGQNRGFSGTVGVGYLAVGVKFLGGREVGFFIGKGVGLAVHGNCLLAQGFHKGFGRTILGRQFTARRHLEVFGLVGGDGHNAVLNLVKDDGGVVAGKGVDLSRTVSGERDLGVVGLEFTRDVDVTLLHINRGVGRRKRACDIHGRRSS